MNSFTSFQRIWRIVALAAALVAPVFAALPAITKQPASVTVAPGGAALISVGITTDSATTYQWRRNGVALPLENNSAIEIEDITSNKLGNYDVVVTNTTGSVTSSVATLSFSAVASTWISDAGFDLPEFARTVLPGRVTRGATSGKLYITRGASALVDGLAGSQSGPLIRLNADGTVDNTFHGVEDLGDIWAVAELPSGQILVGGLSSDESAAFRDPLYRVFRLFADGRIDESYTSPVFGNIPRFITLQADGKALVVPSSGGMTNGGIAVLARLNADGTLDGTFTQPALSAGGAIFAPPVLDVAGKIYIGGIFATVNGTSRNGVARLNANGTLDTGYVPAGYTVTGGTQVRGLALQTQGANAGRLLVTGGAFFVPGSAAPSANRPVIRLNTDGSIDNTFTLLQLADVGSTVRPRLINVLADDSFTVLSASVARLTANGALSGSYTRPTFSTEFFWMETLSDGSVLVNPEPGATITTAAGTFTPTSLVKFDPTGARDMAFNPGVFQNQVYSQEAAVLSTGKLFAWGNFNLTNGASRAGAVRFNADGTVDTGYALSGLANLTGITSGNVASDDRLLATVLQGADPSIATTTIARFAASGALDGTFTLDPSISAAPGLQVYQLPDNRALGWALSPQRLASNSTGFMRLLASGTIDSSFVGFSTNFGTAFRDGTNAITGMTMGAFRVVGVYPDGRILAIASKGPYTQNPTSINMTIMRLNADGSEDTSFVGPVIAAGVSNSFTPAITDATTNGGAPFQVPLAAPGGGSFAGAVPLADGSVLVYGGFSTLGGQPAPGLAKLTNTGAVDLTFNIGAGPEIRSFANVFPSVQSVTVAADGKLWVTGIFDTFGGRGAIGVTRLNADGSVDTSFAASPTLYIYRFAGSNVLLHGADKAYLLGNYEPVTHDGGDFPNAIIKLKLLDEAIITAQPQNTTVTSGSNATLSVTVANATSPTYQWRRNGVNIAGATSSSYQITGARRSDADRYDVVITDGTATHVSEPAFVSVAPTAYPGSLAPDASFNPGLLSLSTRIYAALPLPDGKWLVAGDFVRWGTTDRAFLARLNADYTLDNTFTPPVINQEVYALARGPDGSIYVGGAFTAVDYHAFPGLFRLNPAGQLDLYWAPRDEPPNASVSALAVQADGKLLVGRQSSFVNGQVFQSGLGVLRRLHPNGTLDSSFNVDINTGASGRVFSLAVDPTSGSIALGGNFTAINGVTRNGIARVNTFGVLDPAFAGAAGTNVGAVVFSLSRNADGTYLAGGTFTTMAGASRSRAAIINADGTLNATFVPVTINNSVLGAAMQSDGKVVLAGSFSTANGSATYGLVRLTAAGAVDKLYTDGGVPSSFASVTQARGINVFPQADGSIALFGAFQSVFNQRRTAVAVVDSAGLLASFPTTLVYRTAFTGSVFALNNQTVLFGSIDAASGVVGAVGQSIRFNDDGSVDSAFPQGTGFALNGLSTFGIYRAIRHSDGSFVAVGDLAGYNGNNRAKMVKVSANGTFDGSFNSGTGPSVVFPQTFALSGGKILMFNSGPGFSYNGVASTILRINADGTRDTSFVAGTFAPAAPNFAQTAYEQPDGKVLVTGNFTSYSGTPVPGFMRLQPDGSLDVDFFPGTFTGGGITFIAGLPDGRLVVAGTFTTHNGSPANGMVILFPNGQRDFSFTPPAALNGAVGQVIPQEDGKFLVFGDFTATPSPYATRLNANGTVDATFGLYGLTAGASTGLRFILADDGSIYMHNNPVSLNNGVPVSFARFRGAPVAPTIAVAPVGVTTTAGSPVAFTVRANGTGPFTYQWKLNGEDIEEGSVSIISTDSIDPGANGSLTVTITGPGGSVTSAPVTITVTGPLIVDQPTSRKAVAGGKVLFRVSAEGNGALSYQWKKNTVNIPGATNPDLTLTNLTAGDAATYTVVVSDGSGSVTSQNAVLTVLTPDNVLWQQFTDFSTEMAPARTVHDGAGKVYLPWSVQDRGPDMAAGRVSGPLARFDEATGTYDPTFKIDRRYRRASHIALQPDGKILVATISADAQTVIRVDNTGAVDNTFNAPQFARGIRFITRQSDGKVIVATTDNLAAFPPAGALGAAAPTIYRLNSDGSVDNSFTPAALNATGNVFGPPAVDASGRIYLAGAFTTVAGTGRVNVARLNSNGTLDTTFAGALPAGWASTQARGVDFQSDGRAVFVGDFRYTARGTVGDPIQAVRFNTDGTFDSTFVQPLRSQLNMGAAGIRLRYLVILPTNKIMTVSDRLYLLNADGSPDQNFNGESRQFERETFWVSRAADGRYFVPDQSAVSGENTMLQLWGNGISCFSPDGVPDESFQTGGFGRVSYPGNARVASDGSVWMGGVFNRFGATPLPGVAHFSAPGTLAAAQAVVPAASPTNFRNQPFASVAAAAGDQTFVVWTNASNTTGTFYSSLNRLNADGTIDSSFVPVLPGGYNLGTAGAFAAPGGKLVLAQGTVAAQAALNGSTGDSLIKLNTDGSRDTSYTPALSSFAIVERDGANNVTMIRTGGLNMGQVLADGRALIVVSAVDGNLRVLRLLANGAVDNSFNAPSFGTITGTSGFTAANTFDPVKNVTQQFPITTYSASGLVTSVVQAPNGKVYVGGRFNLNGLPRGLVRLNADGSFDGSFTGTGIATTATDGSPYVSGLAVDASGRLYAGGRFTSFNGTAVDGLLRLNADGSLDAGWSPGFGVRDVPAAGVNLAAIGPKLYVFGTAGTAGESLPSAYRVVDVPSAATINTQPVSQNVTTGRSVTFTVAATSTGPITYQWRRNGNVIPGATSNALLLNNVLPPQAGQYSVTVSSNGFDVASSAATLTVIGATADFSSDGKADLVLTNTRTGDRYIWTMNGTTYSGEAYLGSVPAYWRVSGSGDFDRDGESDLILTNTQTGDRYIWLMDGTTYRDAVHLGTVPTEWEIGGAGDFNADGNVDIIISNTTSGDRYVWLMNGTTFQSDVFLGNQVPAWRIAGVGDFNLDGKPDLLWQNSSTNAGRVWLMNGTTMSSEATLSPGGANWQMADVGDYNADGYSDIVWQNSITGDRRIWLMNGVSLPTSVAIDNLPVEWTLGSAVMAPRAVSGDFNGDGKPDLVLQNRTTGDRYVWLMNGTAYSDAAYLGNIGPDWDLAGKGDFNNDGKPDLVWQNTVTGDRYVWLMNGTTYMGEAYLGNVPPSWEIAGTGDFNSDGKSDLILQNNDTGDRYVWLMNGTTYMGEAYLGRIGPDWRIAGSADFNLDGKADLIWQNRVTGDRYIWTMNGTTYTGEAYLGTVPTDWDLAGAADFSGDGKPDLVLQNTVTGDRYIWTMSGTTYTGEAYLGFVGPAWRIVR